MKALIAPLTACVVGAIAVLGWVPVASALPPGAIAKVFLCAAMVPKYTATTAPFGQVELAPPWNANKWCSPALPYTPPNGRVLCITDVLFANNFAAGGTGGRSTYAILSIGTVVSHAPQWRMTTPLPVPVTLSAVFNNPNAAEAQYMSLHILGYELPGSGGCQP